MSSVLARNPFILNTFFSVFSSQRRFWKYLSKNIERNRNNKVTRIPRFLHALFASSSCRHFFSSEIMKYLLYGYYWHYGSKWMDDRNKE
jgi:hypothetical protein